jgi:hypothetical protein
MEDKFGAVGGIIAGQIEAHGENLLQCHFVQYKSHMTWPGLEPWALRWKISDNRPS